MRLKVLWEDQALADLAELTGRDRRRAKFLYDTIRRMGKLGWAYMGRPVDDDLMYFTVKPFGVFYDLNRYPRTIAVVRIVDARRLSQRPERRLLDELRRQPPRGDAAPGHPPD
jgi:hypothetical protein